MLFDTRRLFFHHEEHEGHEEKLRELKTELKIKCIENDPKKKISFFSPFVLFVAFVVNISEPVPADSYGFSQGRMEPKK